MPQSLSSILVHLVFSTKNRERFISPAIETELKFLIRLAATRSKYHSSQSSMIFVPPRSNCYTARSLSSKLTSDF